MAESDQEQSATISYGTRSIYVVILVISFLVVVPISNLLVPRLIGIVGRIIGFYLRRKTAGRRAQILERVEEEQALLAGGRKRRYSDDDWENVESYEVGTAGNGETAAKDWDGIVGFFHPFWCVFAVAALRKFRMEY
jgi:alpha-1,2-mannosyltransferase